MTTANEFDLNGLPIFVALVEAGSFTKAAERLGCTKTRVSLQIRQLETRLGVTLFLRTTRRVQLTQAGEALYHQCHPLLIDLQGALASTVSDTQQLHGELRITAPEDYAAGVLSDAVVAFSRLHPALHIELRSGDQVSDMVQDGIDLAFRLGWLKDSTLRARRIGTFQQHVVAAPDYLKRYGTPSHPKALEDHAWIAFTPLKAPLTWTFQRRDERYEVQMSAGLAANSTVSLVALMVAGGGLSVLPDMTAAPEIAAGRLVRVLEEWTLPEGGAYAVYPPGRHITAKTRAFMTFFDAWLQKEP
ncbi:LysR family transcriptional regulator [Vreelandella titanicae]|jgi:DNA-binding transcriptional LysR family regulator|uniref:LysR family transcriptional regulator n=1 Tax=Halomonadaceae TaxID=28256 RepID=UPI0004881E80|nr:MULTISPECIES: LysR family transcriptional regulator [Halomonas]MCE7520205.1 LysR family transcriptional regulator [Halomonas titanicae]NAO94632.1 LysR family transcriptional regulator [Halomonas sp. MG34]PKH62027.1 LysR family transcriptional regulator [Halomonas sp. Choline-3u-9]QGQ71674.1 LysR family transcriptional regulator [Halomonas sp. PA16-9]|tara:strand:+ start:3238 stop:4143 length:906 start_codon:yes stop_codon:yes gene_type:complete